MRLKTKKREPMTNNELYDKMQERILDIANPNVDYTQEDFDKEFELKKYFPKQQLRKSFIQTQLLFNHEKEKIKLIVI